MTKEVYSFMGDRVSRTSGATEYYMVGCGYAIPDPLASATETNRKILYRHNGKLKKAFVNVTSNSIASTGSFRARKNESPANILITIPASTTGYLEDTTNTDSYVSGDYLSALLTIATGAGSCTVANSAFQDQSDNIIKLVGQGETNPSTNSTVYGNAGSPRVLNTTERARFLTNVSASIAKLQINISTNTATQTHTIRSRKNGGNGNQVITVTSGTTGRLEDTTNSDSLAVNDDFNMSQNQGAGGSGSIIAESWSLEYTGSNSQHAQLATNNNATNIGAGLVRYSGYGETLFQTAENTQLKVRFSVSCSVSLAVCRVHSNGVTATSTIVSRKNGITGNISISIPASSTGFFEDTTNSDTLATTDLVNFMLTTGAGGTNMQIGSWGVIMALNDGGGGGARACQIVG